jgi:beta-adrenergic-receptor kinase
MLEAMEELADAIEDAQYVNAITTQEDGPKPVVPWEIPTDAELAAWEVRVKSQYTSSDGISADEKAIPFSLEWCCQQPIGYYLFSQYIKEKYKDYARINFCEDVLRFRKLQGKQERLDFAVQMARHFLGFEQTPEIVITKPLSDIDPAQSQIDQREHELDKSTEPNRNVPEEKAATSQPTRQSVWPLPPRTEIEEYDLARPINGSRSEQSTRETFESSFVSKTMMIDPVDEGSCLTRLTEEELSTIFLDGMDHPICSESIIGLKGQTLTEIISVIQVNAFAASTPKVSRTVWDDSAALQKSDSFYKSTSEAFYTLALEAKKSSSSRSLSSAQQHMEANLENMGSSIASTKSHTTDTNLINANVGHGPNVIQDCGPDVRKTELGASNRLEDNNRSATRETLRKSASSKMIVHRIVSFKPDFFDKAEYATIESLRRQYWSTFMASPYWIKLKHFLWYQDRRVIPEDFFVLRVLGRGGFGLVTGMNKKAALFCSFFRFFFALKLIRCYFCGLLLACKKGTSGKLYAMKVMNKRRIKMKRSEALALNERNALAAVESKFVINLKYSFHSNDDVYFLLDLMTGGDLGYHLHQRGRFPKRECLYYAARIMHGLQALHDQGYVFRDLKPENCLLAEDGRVKITDLGLATKISPNLNGAAGTRGYWAPEMLRRDSNGKRMPYDHGVDWFSFGCCVAEFISGSNPFRSEAAIKFGKEKGKPTKEKMIDFATLEMNPEFPPERFESDAADLCRRLLDKNPSTRLGHNGCGEIMEHPWFKSLNWESIISDRKKPPFVPSRDVNAASQSQIGNFAEDNVYQETLLTVVDEEIYKDWDWTNPRAFAAEVIEFWIYERVTGEPLVPVTQNTGCCCTIT